MNFLMFYVEDVVKEKKKTKKAKKKTKVDVSQVVCQCTPVYSTVSFSKVTVNQV